MYNSFLLACVVYSLEYKWYLHKKVEKKMKGINWWTLTFKKESIRRVKTYCTMCNHTPYNLYMDAPIDFYRYSQIWQNWWSYKNWNFAKWFSIFMCVSFSFERKYEATRENKRNVFRAYVSGPDCVILFQIFVKIHGNLGYGNTVYE